MDCMPYRTNGILASITPPYSVLSLMKSIAQANNPISSIDSTIEYLAHKWLAVLPFDLGSIAITSLAWDM